MRSDNNLTTKKPKSCTAAYVKAVFGSRIHEEKGDKQIMSINYVYFFGFPIIFLFL